MPYYPPSTGGGGGGGAVSSVAGRTGDVVLSVADVDNAVAAENDASSHVRISVGEEEGKMSLLVMDENAFRVVVTDFEGESGISLFRDQQDPFALKLVGVNVKDQEMVPPSVSPFSVLTTSTFTQFASTWFSNFAGRDQLLGHNAIGELVWKDESHVTTYREYQINEGSPQLVPDFYPSDIKYEHSFVTCKDANDANIVNTTQDLYIDMSGILYPTRMTGGEIHLSFAVDSLDIYIPSHLTAVNAPTSIADPYTTIKWWFDVSNQRVVFYV